MFLLSVKPSERKDKRYTAKFCLCKVKNACCGTNHKQTSFGDPTATTYVDGASEQKKAAYIARHSKVKGEDFNAPTTAGALSFHLLWGAHRSLKENIKSFKKKFNL